jgi:hypothetical protein
MMDAGNRRNQRGRSGLVSHAGVALLAPGPRVAMNRFEVGRVTGSARWRKGQPNDEYQHHRARSGGRTSCYRRVTKTAAVWSGLGWVVPVREAQQGHGARAAHVDTRSLL